MVLCGLNVVLAHEFAYRPRIFAHCEAVSETNDIAFTALPIAAVVIKRTERGWISRAVVEDADRRDPQKLEPFECIVPG